jgi:L-lactate dehydrogenase
LPPGKVIGSGTILDTARFRALLGEHYTVDPRSVHAYIVGEHGDSEVPLWSLANIGGVPLHDFHSANGIGYDQTKLEHIFEHTRDAAYTIIQRKGATYYAIGLGLLAIVEAIVRNQHTVLTVSSLMNGQYGVNDICISLPTIVGAQGIESVLQLPLSPEEEAAFRQSAATLRERFGHTT